MCHGKYRLIDPLRCQLQASRARQRHLMAERCFRTTFISLLGRASSRSGGYSCFSVKDNSYGADARATGAKTIGISKVSCQASAAPIANYVQRSGGIGYLDGEHPTSAYYWAQTGLNIACRVDTGFCRSEAILWRRTDCVSDFPLREYKFAGLSRQSRSSLILAARCSALS